MSKKKRKKIKVRRTWDIDPSTQVHKVDTDYNRAKSKQDLKEEVEETFDEDNPAFEM